MVRPVEAAQVVGATVATPTTVPVGVGTAVTVTALITDASLVVPSVNLQRLDVAGRVVATLGTLVDNGTGGDAVEHRRARRFDEKRDGGKRGNQLRHQ